MRSFIMNYKALIKGGIITAGLAFLLSLEYRFHIIDPGFVSRGTYTFINILACFLCWALISFLATRLPLYKILGVLGLLLLALLAELLINVQDNPVTVPLIILFWVGVVYLILPAFFKKYRFAILTVYGFVISYYLFLFSTASDYSVDSRLDFANLMLFPIPVFAALWGYEQWRWLTTLKADKAKAELKLLKSQINPHFFFNTLNNLYGLVVEKSDQAPDVVLKLSDMMRYTIYKGRADVVPITDEVIYLENYIELHKIRFQQKVDIRFTKRIATDYKVAPLLFIILLENAFKHGVERMLEGAYIQLELTAKHDQITFSIENNYKPTPKENATGIGLENLRKRLEHIYPNQHRLEIVPQASIFKVQLMIDLK